MPTQGTPGTATGDLARIKEGQLGFDYVFQNEKLFISELTMDILANVHQFGTRHVDYFKFAEGGELLQQLFTLPISTIRDSIVFEIGVAGQQQNRVLDRQNWIQISQILNLYYQSMVQLAQLSGDQQLLSLVMKKAFTAATEAMRQILESFDTRNIDRIVLTEVEQLLGGGGNGGAGPNGSPLAGGANRLAGAGEASRLDPLAQVAALLGGNGAPRSPGVS
jgi:hypothetical protein